MKNYKTKRNPGTPYIRMEKGFPYWYVWVARNVRRTVHRMNWEKENGPIPPGHVIRFKDGNTMNCAIENLECISRKEQAHRIPKENHASGMRKMYQTAEGKAMIKRRGETLKQRWKNGEFPLEERSAKISAMIKSGQMGNPFMRMDDSIVAYWLFPYKPDMAKYVLDNHPELIHAKRQQTLLKRELKKHENPA